MFKLELGGLILILEYFLNELRLEVAIKEIRDADEAPMDASCPFSSFLFPFN